jgi:outer membrane protein assembly factor BamE (lipoprotein component of BamABCDE complex)
MKSIFCLMIFTCLLTSCSSNANRKVKEEKMTIAKVQKEIRIGMSSSAVVEVLGSPNMVTTDDRRRETWVYDRVSTQVSSSQNQSGVWLLLAGSFSSNSDTSQSQRTLTIIIKFDENSKVRDFAYRTSTF